MTRYVQRKGSIRAVEGNYSTAQGPLARELIWHYFVPRTMLLADKTVSQVVHLTTGTPSLALPGGYTDSSVLFARIKTTAKIKVTIVSPTRGTRIIFVAGSAAVPGYLQVQERITSIALKYLTAVAEVSFFAFQVPNLTTTTNFKGVTG